MPLGEYASSLKLPKKKEKTHLRWLCKSSFVEQKDSTHTRGIFRHLRYDTDKELEIINDLCRNELRLYKNFFQPVMRLKEKIREKRKVYRKYDVPKTPYQRLMESEQISEETKEKLKKLCQSLNPAVKEKDR